MSLVLADRVRETTQTTGTGTITLDGAVQGFQSFTVIGNNNTTYYTINRGSEWEVGLGTYYGGTLSRDTIYASSNSGNKVNFSAGAKDVFVTYPAEKSVNEDANNRVLIPYTSGTTNVGSLNVGDATVHTDSGVIAGFTASEPLYLYTSLQNTSASNTSYASYAVNDGGHTAYGELGINNSNYSYSAAGYPNNGFSTPLATFVESYGGPLVLGSWDNQKISMIINGAVSTTDAMTINTNGSVAFNGQVGTAGQILQSNATSAPTWVTPSGGTVTSVTGTAPVVSSGGNTPAISMAAATALVDGYLTSTDWATFNGKQAALVSGTNIKTVNSNSLLGSGNVSVGTVTSVGGTGTVNGLSLSGTVTSSGNLTLGGTLDLSSPPAIGGTAPAAGTFTTLIGTSDLIRTTGNNLFSRSQTFNGTWTSGGANVTVTDNAVTAPVSTTTAEIILPTVTSGLHRILNATTLTIYSGVIYTVSFYAKANGYRYLFANSSTTIGVSSVFDLQSGTVSTTTGTATITSAGNSWYRCTLTGTALTTGSPSFYLQINNTYATGDQSFAGDGTSSIYLWGAQLEIGSSATTYVATTTAGIWNVPTLSFASTSASSIGLQSDGSLYETSAGTGNVRFYTNNIAQEQMRVSHTASAVNYVQVTGATTASKVVAISAQGSDADVTLSLSPKGAGTIRFGTYTGTILTPTGYITITDSGGTSRRLLVG